MWVDGLSAEIPVDLLESLSFELLGEVLPHLARRYFLGRPSVYACLYTLAEVVHELQDLEGDIDARRGRRQR